MDILQRVMTLQNIKFKRTMMYRMNFKTRTVNLYLLHGEREKAKEKTKQNNEIMINRII